MHAVTGQTPLYLAGSFSSRDVECVGRGIGRKKKAFREIKDSIRGQVVIMAVARMEESASVLRVGGRWCWRRRKMGGSTVNGCVAK